MNFKYLPLKTNYEVDDIISVTANARPRPYFIWTIKDHKHVCLVYNINGIQLIKYYNILKLYLFY